MAETFRQVGEIVSYHAHVYFDPDRDRRIALEIRGAVADRFPVRLGRIWYRPVGSHSQAMYQIAFETAIFSTLVPWLMMNSQGLSVLIHPNTTNPRRDHLSDSVWIGTPLPLGAETLPADQEADLAGTPNTTPHIEP